MSWKYRNDETDVKFGIGAPSSTPLRPELYLDQSTGMLYVNRGGTSIWTPRDETKFCTTEFVAVAGTTGTTLTDIVGLTGFNLIAGASYAFELNLGTVGTSNSGVKIGFALTTATLTSIEYQVTGFVAAGVAASRGTTATSGTAIYGATTATLIVRATGRMVVNAAGTLAFQAAQNAAHADETKVFVGSWARLTRVG